MCRGPAYTLAPCPSARTVYACTHLQAIGKLRLDTDKPVGGARPKALGMESCVGTEYVPFKTPLPLEGKVWRGGGRGLLLGTGCLQRLAWSIGGAMLQLN